MSRFACSRCDQVAEPDDLVTVALCGAGCCSRYICRACWDHGDRPVPAIPVLDDVA